jgi:SAM-dependent methyltransferase
MNPVEVYDLFAPFYDSYISGFNADLPLYKQLCRSCHSIVEVGCGSGRILQSLLESDSELTGVDISPAMLSLAVERLAASVASGRLKLINHNLCHAPLAQTYEIALVSYYTFNYLLSDSECNAFLANSYASLAGNGRIVMDLFYPKTLAEPETDDQWTTETFQQAGKGVTLRQKRHVRDNIEMRSQVFSTGDSQQEIVTRRRYYDKKEILELLERAGFAQVQFARGYDYASFQPIDRNERTTSGFVVSGVKK